MNREDEYFKLYNELIDITNEIKPYYDIDKIKPYSVYIWTKDKGKTFGENVFDIQENRIVFYVKDHKIPVKVMPIIERIQAKLKEISMFLSK